jgi:apolipoprotein N-acyltransferase
VKRKTFLFLALLSGILLALPWYQEFSGIIILIAFIPLLLIEDYVSTTGKKNKPIVFIGYSALTFFIWNALSTYWIYNAAFIAVIAAILVNTLLMTSTFWLFYFTKRNLGSKAGYFSFITYWLGFEYFYLNAEISWPWLNLGNAFAKDINLIQWYEYTGALGGTFWVLFSNLILFFIIKSYINRKSLKSTLPQLVFYILIIIIPISISLSIYSNYEEKGKEYSVAVIQPNIDPYNTNSGNLWNYQQLNSIIQLADSISDENTDYIVAPETSLGGSVWEQNIKTNKSIQTIKDFVKNHPNTNFVIGMNYYKKYMQNEEKSSTARYWEDENIYYDVYNSAIQINVNNHYPVYHKSKLVVGVEKMPYPKLFKPLEQFINKMGGTIASCGSQKFRETFKNSLDDTRIAPVICYESVYGEFVTDYIKKGASFIFVITNDGWWGDTPGYKQHLTYSQLRAIETRRSVARSANTGISAFINQKGEILNRTEWWTRCAIKNTLKANNEITFYVKYGDYIGRLSGFLAIFLFLYTIVQQILNKSKEKKLLKHSKIE